MLTAGSLCVLGSIQHENINCLEVISQFLLRVKRICFEVLDFEA